MAPLMAEHTEQRRRPRTGVYPGTFDPIHNGHFDIMPRDHV
jgi:phosphopantetheine adenylyltransferase